MSAASMTQRWHALDARMLQMSFQGGLLLIGALTRDFALSGWQVALTFATALACQTVWLRRLGLQPKGLWSAVVTAFGLSLLVRADNLWVHPLLAAVAISSKFLWRYDFVPGQPSAGSSHVFNPANLGAALAATVLPGAWLSPGQWGQATGLALLFVALGATVSAKAARSDASWVFLVSFLTLVAARVLWLGANPWVIWHQMNNGALLLFAFFMISDPLTTPRDPLARRGFAVGVAVGAFAWQTLMFRPNGPVLALCLASLIVPWLNRRSAARGARLAYAWRPATQAERDIRHTCLPTVSSL